MVVRERILTIRLLEKAMKHPDIAQRLGISVAIRKAGVIDHAQPA